MPSRRRPSLVLVLALVAALAFGAAASLLIGAASPPGASPPRTTEWVLPGWVFGVGILSAAAALFGWFIFDRLRSGAIGLPGRPVAMVLVVILLLVAFVALSRVFVGGGPQSTGEVNGIGQNATAAGQNNSTLNATSAPGSGGVLSFWSPTLPPWLPFVVVCAVLLVVVAVALPLTRRYLSDRRELRNRRLSDSQRKVAAEVKGALSRAAEELDRGGDPRAVIEALYASVLNRLTPIVGGVEVETPEEIRSQHLVRLGIRPEAATVLTRLFEEARYSSHPLAGEAAEAARVAVRDALSDLAQNPVPA
jgi:hypothetical protein